MVNYNKIRKQIEIVLNFVNTEILKIVYRCKGKGINFYNPFPLTLESLLEYHNKITNNIKKLTYLLKHLDIFMEMYITDYFLV